MENPIPRLNLNENDEVPVESDAISISSTNRSDNLPSVDPLKRRNLFVITEFRSICNRPPEGIYVRPSELDLLEWYGVIVVKAGVFAGGIFRFTLTLSPSFPDTDQIPTVEFELNLFHPMIHPKTNRVDFHRFFPSGWAPDRNHIYHVLQALQALFFRYDCTLDQAANPEAALLWADDRKKFKKMANTAVRDSRTQIYDPPKSDDPQALKFKPWDGSIMEPVLSMIHGTTTPPKEHPLNDVLSRQDNPFASFFNVEKTKYLCDVLPDVNAERKDSDPDLDMDVQSDDIEEEIPDSSYVAGIEEEDDV
ncbi:unnamed protein product [Bursaphelenchus xylophilus]|uniref:(pine wood nematode) hypothetical protein n=1 Tax=Bursaphelenchus xylophilus TaxID=6326 RepID=A0A1I7SKX7_BURXY|nr:unnamed protein product [Bursaphelenchus xylophilus]CAG9129287.1 unnamed protein product [Bursaphelenchus xylophilus]